MKRMHRSLMSLGCPRIEGSFLDIRSVVFVDHSLPSTHPARYMRAACTQFALFESARVSLTRAQIPSEPPPPLTTAARAAADTARDDARTDGWIVYSSDRRTSDSASIAAAAKRFYFRAILWPYFIEGLRVLLVFMPLNTLSFAAIDWKF